MTSKQNQTEVFTLPAGTVCKRNGIPFKLQQATQIECHPENWALIKDEPPECEGECVVHKPRTSKQEEGVSASSPQPIPLECLVSEDGRVEIKRAMHSVALDAANAWAKLGSDGRTETVFAQGVAKVYMATLRELARDFSRGPESPGERV